jgi:hypothetical protein
MKTCLLVSIIGFPAAPLQSTDAAPPPPPQAYVRAVADLLTENETANTLEQLSSYVADDVRAFVNDKLVSDGKADWLRHYVPAPNRPMAVSAGWQNNGSLMLVDVVDSVDRSELSRGFIADPDYLSRVTLYQFGPDHEIHAIRTLVGGGFWTRPNPQ